MADFFQFWRTLAIRTMGITASLDSIIFYVQDVDRLKHFYTSIFGMEVIEESAQTWVLLKAGNINLGLHRMGQQYFDKNGKLFRVENNVKIVFQVDDDIHYLREQLLAQQVSMREVKTFDNYGYWLCDGEDPEGNVFQLKQQKL